VKVSSACGADAEEHHRERLNAPLERIVGTGRARLADKHIMKAPDVIALKREMRISLLSFIYGGRNR
jgi:hypothetical protein